MLDGRLCVVRDAIQCSSVPAGAVVDLSFDARGKRLITLTSDGVVHVYDRTTFAPAAELALVAPPSAGAAATASPALALGRRFLYVSDPEREQVHVFDPTTGKAMSSVRIPGAAPTTLAVFRYPE